MPATPPGPGSSRARYRGLASRGASVAVEFAIVLPLLLTFVFMIIDGSRLLWCNSVLARAVAVASRCAVVDPTTCGTVSAVQTYAAAQVQGWAVSPTPTFTVTNPACGWQVTGTMTFQFVIPWFYAASAFGASNTLALSQSACFLA